MMADGGRFDNSKNEVCSVRPRPPKWPWLGPFDDLVGPLTYIYVTLISLAALYPLIWP